jgi:hypothetical protein
MKKSNCGKQQQNADKTQAEEAQQPSYISHGEKISTIRTLAQEGGR